MQEMQERFLEEDPRVGIIQEYLDRVKPERVCVALLYQKALGNEGIIPTRAESNQLHDIMQNAIRGWVRLPGGKSGGRGRIEGYGVQVCYVPEKVDSQTKFIEIGQFDIDEIFDTQ